MKTYDKASEDLMAKLMSREVGDDKTAARLDIKTAEGKKAWAEEIEANPDFYLEVAPNFPPVVEWKRRKGIK